MSPCLFNVYLGCSDEKYENENGREISEGGERVEITWAYNILHVQSRKKTFSTASRDNERAIESVPKSD